MKAIVFAYHNIGFTGIEMLVDAGFDIPLVFTHEDNPDENVWFKSVKDLCRRLSIESAAPENPNTPEWIEKIREISPDIIFSFYYRHMISMEILRIPVLGGYNLHGSYLPAYRGRCPVNWVIIKGERDTGVTLHEMVEKPDAGPIVARRKVEIAEDDTALTLFKKLDEATRALLKEILPEIKSGNISKIPQDLSAGSYFSGRRPEDGRISWDSPAREIYNLIRGVTRPYPGAFAFAGENKVLFWSAAYTDDTTHAPGKIIHTEDTVMIGTQKGCILPQEIETGGSVLKGRELAAWFKQYKGEYVQ
ncbi:MAG: formyltransferase [Deltaproteobacteria bacterium]|nr:formyltransferase [Deltaproteobacteria bacterium]